MKNIKVIITLLVLSFLTPTFALAQSGMNVGDKTIKLDKVKYEAEIKKLFGGNVMGYQVILLENGKIVSELADGRARNAFDGKAKMTVNTPANIGSTAKFFGGMALLHKFQENFSSLGGGINA